MQPMDTEALKTGRNVIRRRRMDAENRQDLKSLLVRVLVAAAAAWVLFTQVFLVMQAKGSGMFPAVKGGDLLICYRLQAAYAKNATHRAAGSAWAASWGARATGSPWTIPAP